MQHNITRLGHLGDGVAEGPIFAACTLPGEVIEGELTGDRIAKPRIVKPSPERVSAPCRHYKSCGGCALQHASDRFVADWKTGVVRHALEAHGLDAPIRKVITSPPSTRRRAALTGRRFKSGPVVGFHAPSSEAVTAIPDCKLLSPELTSGLPALEALTATLGSRKGEMRFTVTASETGLDVNATGGRPITNSYWQALANLARTHNLARLCVNGELVVERHPPALQFDVIAVVPPPGAFLQATTSGETALLAGVRETTFTASKVIDLFAGCGTFSLPVAKNAEVHAVEGEAALLAALDEGWRKAKGLKKISTETRDLFRRPVLPDELARFDVAVIDPPRAGAETQINALADAQIQSIAYVSCNPQTFARDAKILTNAGYALHWIDVIDQFRWATHVELVASFQR